MSVGNTDDGLDLWQLLSTLWKGKWLILALTTLGTAISLAIAINLPNEYKATVILTPASASGTSSLSRLAGQFGGLASLAGVNLGGQGDGDKTVAAMELVKSWSFQEQFINDNQLEVAVFAAKGWNPSTNQLVIDPEIYDAKQRKWVGTFKSVGGPATQPGSWDIYQELSKRIAISQDKKTSLITLSVEYYSPHMAKEWADKIVVAVNKHVQEQDRLEASKSIEYLKEKMNQTGLTEMKTVFSRLIEEQTKNLMLADVSNEYVLKTLSPAKTPEQKSRPKRALICVLGTLVGGLLSVLIWFGYSVRKTRRGSV